MSATTPPAVCRHSGCWCPALLGTLRLCGPCAAAYWRWRLWRDELVAGDLADAGYGPDDPIDPEQLPGLEAMATPHP